MSTTVKNCFTEREAAEYIGMSQAYLSYDRMAGTQPNRVAGPSYLKVGRSVRYLKSDLDEWLQRHRVARDPNPPY